MEFLIREETKHIAIFSSMKDKIEADPLPEAYPGQARRYIDSFVKNEVFYPPEDVSQKASQMRDPQEPVDFAIELEKPSIDFYGSIKKVVRRSESGTLEDIIDKERRHIDYLIELRKKLQSESIGALPRPTSARER